MTVGKGDWWTDALGDFRKEECRFLASLPDKTVVVDTSSWVHKMDGIHEVAYARTCTPTPYPHPILKYSFAAKVKVLKKLGITPLFVFDGKTTNVKMRENERRTRLSKSSRELYRSKVNAVREQLAKGETISDNEREEIFKLRRKSSRPTPEDYAFICQWMNDNDIAYMQAPFEADAQMKALIDEGKASAAISEDGDLVIYGVPQIWTKTLVNTKGKPEKSTCQYFELEKLKHGDYNSPIAVGDRINYLPEISCFLGNDYIERIRGNGVATVFATGARRKNVAVIDSFVNKTSSETEWLKALEKPTENPPKSPTEWTADRFIRTRNLIRHYPVFKRSSSGVVTLEPLNPLPASVLYQHWGDYIGFEKHPSDYFDGTNYSQYYSMELVGCTGRPRADHLGPKYSVEEHPDVDTNELLPVFTRINFDTDPVAIQPVIVLRAFLLNHGIPTSNADTDEMIRQWSQRAHNEHKLVLPPSMVLQPAKWVGFEVLDELELGDVYDDWVSYYEFMLATQQDINMFLFLLQSRDYTPKLRTLLEVNDNYIDKHFGTESAQYERVSAFQLLNGGNLGVKSIKVRNVRSGLRPNTNLLAFGFDCLSSERSIVHRVYMVFENKEGGEYVASPCSFCSCESGAFFCSHMLCFLFYVRIVQRAVWSQEDVESVMPLDRRLMQNSPCLIEHILMDDKIRRQRAQTERQRKRKAEEINE